MRRPVDLLSIVLGALGNGHIIACDPVEGDGATHAYRCINCDAEIRHTPERDELAVAVEGLEGPCCQRGADDEDGWDGPAFYQPVYGMLEH